MSAVTIELPEALIREIEARGLSQPQLEEVIIKLVQAYLQESQEESFLPEQDWTDGATFARQVIAKNRELFEELARL
ncbi:MAG TPA: hypothetical protein VER55_00200 [Ardenticatenaceae bacterium]|nr:hypothetical protein [Ardenticatenaceae bacterium]